MNDRNKINICQDKKVNDAANKYFILFKIFILVYFINKALSHKSPSYRHSGKKWSFLWEWEQKSVGNRKKYDRHTKDIDNKISLDIIVTILNYIGFLFFCLFVKV